ncbi:hypothetical protein [Estrella lausannensis]|nr:hypothetical protein [Estrella lausannensis]
MKSVKLTFVFKEEIMRCFGVVVRKAVTLGGRSCTDALVSGKGVR